MGRGMLKGRGHWKEEDVEGDGVVKIVIFRYFWFVDSSIS
jgi:hypothetical protein